MKTNAIIYTSNTGYTKQYAVMLGEKTGLSVYSLEEAKEKLPSKSSAIYLGWIMAGKIMGYAKAAKYFNIAAVCGVGMGATGTQTEDLRKVNSLPFSLPIFTLQGGFDKKRLNGVYKFMMTFISNTVGKKLGKKSDRTPEEEDMLSLLINGGSRVSEGNLDLVLDWYNN